MYPPSEGKVKEGEGSLGKEAGEDIGRMVEGTLLWMTKHHPYFQTDLVHKFRQYLLRSVYCIDPLFLLSAYVQREKVETEMCIWWGTEKQRKEKSRNEKSNAE